MSIEPAWIATFVVTIFFGVITFFIKRLIANIDKNNEKINAKFDRNLRNVNEMSKEINEKIDKMRDRLINQREKQAVHEAMVNQELIQVEKNIEVCLSELRTLHQLQMDVNNIGHKVRKIEDKA